MYRVDGATSRPRAPTICWHSEGCPVLDVSRMGLGPSRNPDQPGLATMSLVVHGRVVKLSAQRFAHVVAWCGVECDRLLR